MQYNDSSAPLEIERKFIIKMPDPEVLLCAENYTSSAITQIYLESDSGITHRIRKREYEGRTEYTETKKIRIDKMTAIEDEREISGADFEKLKLNIKKGSAPLSKLRRAFDFRGFTFEIDSYPKWERTAIMEVELRDASVEIKFPDFITVIKEVTGERAYTNAAMAESFPKEYEV